MVSSFLWCARHGSNLYGAALTMKAVVVAS
ncbi:hypothetical protein SRABI96_01379 [Peribacillus sp. Bi96]|nr:hypothetical protein SRABI96_01379 [Peribacillus sp. Bi96]